MLAEGPGLNDAIARLTPMGVDELKTNDLGTQLIHESGHV